MADFPLNYTESRAGEYNPGSGLNPGPARGSSPRARWRVVLWGGWLIGMAGLNLFGATPPASYTQKLAEFQKEIAADPANVALLLRAAEYCHEEGGNDNAEAVKRGEKYLKEVLRLRPADARATVLLGSIYTMKARDTFWPFKRLSLVRDGNRLMDRAVELAPDRIDIRLIRATNNRHMPGWLGREDIVRADFAWLWERVEKNPELFSLEDRQDIALFFGRSLVHARQAARATEVWRKGEAFDPATREAADIRKELAKNR